MDGNKTLGYVLAGGATVVGVTAIQKYQEDKAQLVEIDYNKLFGLSLIVGGTAMLSYYTLKPRPSMFSMMGVMGSVSGLIVTLAMK